MFQLLQAENTCVNKYPSLYSLDRPTPMARTYLPQALDSARLTCSVCLPHPIFSIRPSTSYHSLQALITDSCHAGLSLSLPSLLADILRLSMKFSKSPVYLWVSGHSSQREPQLAQLTQATVVIASKLLREHYAVGRVLNLSTGPRQAAIWTARGAARRAAQNSEHLSAARCPSSLSGSPVTAFKYPNNFREQS